MAEEKKLEFTIRYSGDITSANGITIRTLGNTLPHFQRALDKAAIYEEDQKYKKGYGIGPYGYGLADLEFFMPEKGSFILPLYGKLKEGTVDFFKWALNDPHSKAKVGDVAPDRKHQIQTYKTRVKSDDVQYVTQKDILDRSERDKRKHAQSALLQDMNKMFSVIRRAGEHQIDIGIKRPGKEAVYTFDRATATNFRKIVEESRPTEPVVYKGKYRGYKQLGETSRFEVYVYSLYSKQVVTVYVEGEADLIEFQTLKNNQEIKFWASPLQKYGAFDPYNGSAVFITMVA